MDLTKIIKSGPNRIRLSSIGIKDLLAGSQDDMQNLNRSLSSLKWRLAIFNYVLDTNKRIWSILAMCFSQSHQICCHCPIIRRALVRFHKFFAVATIWLLASLRHFTTNKTPIYLSLGKALDIVQKNFSKDLHQVIIYLIFGPNSSGQIRYEKILEFHVKFPFRNRSINELMPMIGARFYTIIDDVLLRGDRIEDELRWVLFIFQVIYDCLLLYMYFCYSRSFYK